MRIPFVDLQAQYLLIKEEIDGAIAQVIAESAYIRWRHVDAFERGKLTTGRPRSQAVAEPILNRI